ncbi:hypothetical protein [Sphingomonas sp. S-NIH.Pt15_0812]|jgi:hypothetical protein|uniref:hypothetical protein n=1 Tax=Sphingomonas sp. S-NIH.Pt15_0812 TaxID=1920129 RepID=UPI000F7ED112|nr:hypothetical protein [Sphingomonas sp. S-NIH.Pt15_0812]
MHRQQAGAGYKQMGVKRSVPTSCGLFMVPINEDACHGMLGNFKNLFIFIGFRKDFLSGSGQLSANDATQPGSAT